jgi:hypothetical protein
MARTIKEIADSIKEAFVNSVLLRGLYGLNENKTFEEQFSSVSVESLIIETHAAAAASIEAMHEWHLRDITQRIEQERYGYAGWYVKMMLAFQFGFDINELEEQTYYNDTTSDNAIDARIIKFAYAFDTPNSLGVIIKIAKADQNGYPTPLDNFELTVATSYINRIKPAGIPIKIVNENADILDITVKIIYDPLVFNSEDDVEDKVKKAINDYLHGIEFNGSFVSMKMIDQLQLTKGIVIALENKIEVTHVGYAPENITGLVSHIPASGAMKLGNLVTIKEAYNKNMKYEI